MAVQALLVWLTLRSPGAWCADFSCPVASYFVTPWITLFQCFPPRTLAFGITSKVSFETYLQQAVKRVARSSYFKGLRILFNFFRNMFGNDCHVRVPFI